MYISHETKDGFKCILTALLVIMLIIGVYNLFFVSEQICLGRIISIDIENTGGRFGSIRYYCFFDNGKIHSFATPKRIGELVFIPTPRFRW